MEHVLDVPSFLWGLHNVGNISYVSLAYCCNVKDTEVIFCWRTANTAGEAGRARFGVY